MRQLKDLAVAGKRVLIRADLNVPLNEKLEITDDNRIKQFLPTLQHVLAQGGRAILMSHLGEPSGRDAALSLKPVGTRLAELLGTDVIIASDCVGSKVNGAADSAMIKVSDLTLAASAVGINPTTPAARTPADSIDIRLRKLAFMCSPFLG